MSRLDIIYLLILVLSIPYGLLVQTGGQRTIRQLMCLSTGVLIVLLLVGAHGSLHSLSAVVGTHLIIKLSPIRHIYWLTFVYLFGYLLFYRTCYMLGFPRPPQHSNAVQLLVTIRMISLAYEYSQKKLNDKKDDKKEKTDNLENISLLDTFTYAYCYIGLMTGPFYTYKTFNEMLNRDSQEVKGIRQAVRRLKPLPIISVGYLVLKHYYPSEYLDSHECANAGPLYSLYVSSIIYMWYHWRYFIGWLLAEVMCMTAGLGRYPSNVVCRSGGGPTGEFKDKDTTNDEYNFATIVNINVAEIETASSFQYYLKNWNTTVQWWMTTYIYKQLPFKSKSLKMGITFFLSCYWHGIHAGYYLTGICYTLALVSDTMLERSMCPLLNTPAKQKVWRWFRSAHTYLLIGFTVIPFHYQSLGRSLQLWRVMNYWGFVSMVAINAVAFVVAKIFGPPGKLSSEVKKLS